MYVPDNLHKRSFRDWNWLIKGLVEMWELARLTGLEERLERALKRDRDGAVTERFALAGNCWPALACVALLRSHGAEGAHISIPSGSLQMRISDLLAEAGLETAPA